MYKGLAKKCNWKGTVRQKCSFGYIHREIDIAAEEAIYKFAEKRRLFVTFCMYLTQFHLKYTN